MIKEKVYTSIEQFQREVFPNDVLERLKDKLVSHLGLKNNAEFRLDADDKNPNLGSIEILLPNCCLPERESLDEVIKNFYREEGYKVEQENKNSLIIAKKGKKAYWIHTGESGLVYNILIGKGI